MRSAPLELHVALIGMTGSGKSALAVKYMTKRFIGEYDPTLEDTYCVQDSVEGQPLMVWLMDTVDGSGRYLSWSDVFVVVYDITSGLSLQYAEALLEKIHRHEHLLCVRDHKTLLLGNKSDLERYRQVSEADGRRCAAKWGARFEETSAVSESRPLAALLHSTARLDARSPSPRLCSSDSEIVSSSSRKGFSFRSSGRGPRSNTPKALQLQKSPSSSKAGSKLRKFFHN